MGESAKTDNPYTRGIAEFVSGLTYDAVPDEARAQDRPAARGRAVLNLRAPAAHCPWPGQDVDGRGGPLYRARLLG